MIWEFQQSMQNLAEQAKNLSEPFFIGIFLFALSLSSICPLRDSRQGY